MPTTITGNVAIASSTNASPIAITTAEPHQLSTGNSVNITAHLINTAANGTWTITVTSGFSFTLNGSTGNGVGGATGYVTTYPASFPVPSDGDPDAAASVIAAFQALANQVGFLNLAGQTWAQEIFTTAGSHTWTVPLGAVGPAYVTGCGAGGGGGGGATGPTTSAETSLGGGGGAGAIAQTQYATLTPGATVTVVVGNSSGNGGAAGTAGLSGPSSSFGSLVFPGGMGGPSSATIVGSSQEGYLPGGGTVTGSVYAPLPALTTGGPPVGLPTGLGNGGTAVTATGGGQAASFAGCPSLGGSGGGGGTQGAATSSDLGGGGGGGGGAGPYGPGGGGGGGGGGGTATGGAAGAAGGSGASAGTAGGAGGVVSNQGGAGGAGGSPAANTGAGGGGGGAGGMGPTTGGTGAAGADGGTGYISVLYLTTTSGV